MLCDRTKKSHAMTRKIYESKYNVHQENSCKTDKNSDVKIVNKSTVPTDNLHPTNPTTLLPVLPLLPILATNIPTITTAPTSAVLVTSLLTKLGMYTPW